MGRWLQQRTRATRGGGDSVAIAASSVQLAAACVSTYHAHADASQHTAQPAGLDPALTGLRAAVGAHMTAALSLSPAPYVTCLLNLYTCPLHGPWALGYLWHPWNR